MEDFLELLEARDPVAYERKGVSGVVPSPYFWFKCKLTALQVAGIEALQVPNAVWVEVAEVFVFVLVVDVETVEDLLFVLDALYALEVEALVAAV